MKRKEIEGMSSDELKAKLEELCKELIKENGQIAAGTVPKSPGKLGDAKKNIAKIRAQMNTKKQVTK
jgi:ribosomal protein L29